MWINEVTIKSSEVEIVAPSAESNENCCEITSERCGEFAGSALRRHRATTAAQTASSGDAADVGLGLPSAASTQEPVMTDSLKSANNSGRQTVSVERSSGSTDIIVANYASSGFTFRC
eukprot:XP_016662211.1 PREDICTED: uncharacterized protein LOC107884496 isoform X2 [Acyrthosiphon pisum]